jgi:hypothetical protein
MMINNRNIIGVIPVFLVEVIGIVVSDGSLKAAAVIVYPVDAAEAQAVTQGCRWSPP